MKTNRIRDWEATSFYRPYKGLKWNLFSLHFRKAFVFIVPIRDWNDTEEDWEIIIVKRFYRPYKGLKQEDVHNVRKKISDVFIVPIRDWNHLSFFSYSAGHHSFYRPYKGLKLTLLIILSLKPIPVFIVPIRDWNLN